MVFLHEYRRMNIMYCNNLPSRTCHGLRIRRHNYTLNIKTDYDDRSFITRLLYKDITDCLFNSLFSSVSSHCISCALTTFSLNGDDDDDDDDDT